MLNNNKSTLVLMVQNSRNVFCYFNISSFTVKIFEDRYGEDSWCNSKPALKLFQIDNGNAKEIKTIFLDPFADNWYIHLDNDGMDLFIKYGRILPDDTFAALIVSNTVTTPRSHQSSDAAVYFVDTSHSRVNTEESMLQTYASQAEFSNGHHEPKPYPFMETKFK